MFYENVYVCGNVLVGIVVVVFDFFLDVFVNCFVGEVSGFLFMLVVFRVYFFCFGEVY